MTKEKYLSQIRDTVHKFSRGRDLKFFIYGSSLVKDRFDDVDIGATRLLALTLGLWQIG